MMEYLVPRLWTYTNRQPMTGGGPGTTGTTRQIEFICPWSDVVGTEANSSRDYGK
jgi:hypothetical protein